MPKQNSMLCDTKDIDEFRAQLEEADVLPSVPNVVLELMNLLGDEESTNEELSRVVSQDTGLVARTLKLVNSAGMGLRQQVTSIQQAIGLLGRSQLRQVALGGGVWDALTPYAKKANFDLVAFDKHCQVTAEIARALAQRTSLAIPDDVYSAAMLHDIGKFLLLAYDGETYSETLVQAREEKANLVEMEYTFMGWTHPVVGGWLTDYWNLPRAVRETVRWHHQPAEKVDQTDGRLIAMVAVANNLSKVVKLGWSGNPQVLSIGKLLGPLGLSPKDVQEIGEQAKDWQKAA